MDLIFQETPNRHQCSCEFMVNNTTTQCTFSSSMTVTLPRGLVFFDGRLEQNESLTDSTFSICQNHKARLKNVFAELLIKNKS